MALLFTTNGKELLTYLDDTIANLPPVSLILLDINMPVRNKLETLRDLRVLATYKETSVVGLSTTHNKDVIDAFIQPEGNEYLQKPETIDGFEKIQTLLSAIAQGRENLAAS
ncbi:response regulator [Cytophagaceae bacterium YF14B1]|uniref:Response regulator n=1 Tax=Xanthocytophaga flava TaxID=3048013 RepID=A0AAE3QNU7_9BACT|nr:response regulator [Xanthocytophaga flavus]MDJ1480845.1 response regulator [Xanthocytophaga flavus]